MTKSRNFSNFLEEFLETEGFLKVELYNLQIVSSYRAETYWLKNTSTYDRQ